MVTRARKAARRLSSLLAGLVEFVGSPKKNVLFVSWRAHVAICVGVFLAYRTFSAVGTYIAALVTLRFMTLWVWLVWRLIAWSLRMHAALWRGVWNFLFRFIPWDDVVPLAPAQAPASKREEASPIDALMSKHTIYVLEGNICAGKTRLANWLDKCRNVQVHFENVPEDVLERFNKTQDGVEIQRVMGRMRCASLRDSVIGRATTHVHDRSVIGCRAFAYWNYVLGNLSRRTLTDYLAECGGPLLRDADWFDRRSAPAQIRVVYLPLPVATSLERLAQRPGVDQRTSERYLLGVSLMHALVLYSFARHRSDSFRFALSSSDIVGDMSRAAEAICGSAGDCTGRCRLALLEQACAHDWYAINLLEYKGHLALSPDELGRLSELGDGELELSRYTALAVCHTERDWNSLLLTGLLPPLSLPSTSARARSPLRPVRYAQTPDRIDDLDGPTRKERSKEAKSE